MIAGDSDALSPHDASIISENIYLSDLDADSRKSFEMAMHGRVAQLQGLPPPDDCPLLEDLNVEAASIAPVDANLFNSAWRAQVAQEPPVLSPGTERNQEAAASACSVVQTAVPVNPVPALLALPCAASIEFEVPSTRVPVSEAFDAFGLEPEVKALALSLFDLRLGLKKHCAEYAAGLALQGVLSVDHLRRVSEVDAWGIIKRAGLKVIPQQNLMQHVFGKSVVDPDREAEDRFALVVPQEQIVEAKNVLKVRMDEQKLRVANDRSPPLTDEQRATLHPEVQKM